MAEAFGVLPMRARPRARGSGLARTQANEGRHQALDGVAIAIAPRTAREEAARRPGWRYPTCSHAQRSQKFLKALGHSISIEAHLRDIETVAEATPLILRKVASAEHTIERRKPGLS